MELLAVRSGAEIALEVRHPEPSTCEVEVEGAQAALQTPGRIPQECLAGHRVHRAKAGSVHRAGPLEVASERVVEPTEVTPGVHGRVGDRQGVEGGWSYVAL